MKTVAFSSLAVMCLTLFVSCKDEPKTNIEIEPEISTTEKDLAIADDSFESVEDSETTFLYVTAYTGLSLREYNNLQSEKLAIMPYGTKVKVLSPEGKGTMTVGGIKGGMDQVEFNHKKGYAFNGYLSRFFPPEKDISSKGYSLELKEVFPDVIYTETTGGTASNPTTTQTLTLPKGKWHEAYFIAQRLFEIPGEFTFPTQKGIQKQTLQDSKPKKGVWTSELQITRNDNALQKIEYVYKSKKFDSNVIVTVKGDIATISKTEIIK